MSGLKQRRRGGGRETRRRGPFRGRVARVLLDASRHVFVPRGRYVLVVARLVLADRSSSYVFVPPRSTKSARKNLGEAGEYLSCLSLCARLTDFHESSSRLSKSSSTRGSVLTPWCAFTSALACASTRTGTWHELPDCSPSFHILIMSRRLPATSSRSPQSPQVRRPLVPRPSD